jgi:uncharacterized delta-60 repeat protein
MAGFAPLFRSSIATRTGASIVKKGSDAVRILVLIAGLALAGCGGGGDSGGDPAPPPPPAPAGIGAAGGTVAGPSGAQVVVPAGALTSSIEIVVAQSSAGAPALTTGLTSYGQIFAFTPHGTTFTMPVTVTVPFDPSLVPAGATPALYKTNAARTAWDVVAGATVSGSTMTAPVSGFSNFVVASFPAFTVKTWKLWAYDDHGAPPTPLAGATQFGGKLDKFIQVGKPLIFHPAGQTDERARIGVFSNESGKTFWTFAEAPNSSLSEPYNTSNAEIEQKYTFQKNEATATLRFVLTVAGVEAIDGGGAEPGATVCPWLSSNASEADIAGECGDFMMIAIDSFSLKARNIRGFDDFFTLGGDLKLQGHHGQWNYGATHRTEEFPLWLNSDFNVNTHEAEDPALRHTSLQLKAPITINVPLGQVPVGGKFNVIVNMGSLATNLVQGESEVLATMTDPLETNGLALDFTGLEQVAPIDDVPANPVPQPCATSPDPAAGTIQFTQGTFLFPERPHGADVLIQRTGGKTGAATVQLETSDGTALAGGDYQSVKTLVRFADGDDSLRTVTIPLILDGVEEPDETVNVTLTTFSGCATLGMRSTAAVTILDDDRPVAVTPTFTLAGTVSGLSGSGLVLQTNTGDRVTPAANGAFAFTTPLLNGAAYSVSVATQPGNPAQVCTLTNGSGTIAAANVTNILVACATPQPNGSLDAGFGSQGKLFDTSSRATNILLQPDGKLLVLGGMSLSRYNADGSLDASFGTAGRVAIVADGSANDAGHSLALQSDGKILAVGRTTRPTVFNNRFFVQRFNVDGSLDVGFGAGGKVFTDFGVFTDDAKSVIVQPDGKILVAGIATLGPLGLPDQDFAVVRYLSDGTLDPSFGTGGIATKNVAGRSDFASAAALQTDGSIVVTGRVFTDNGSGNSDMGVVRFLANGSPDNTFGGDGVVRIDFGQGGDVPATFNGGDWDEPNDILIQPDGKIVIAGYTGIASFTLISKAAVVRLTTAGLADPTFGTLGLATFDALDRVNGVALQADGKVVIVGTATNDFGIARFTSAGVTDAAFGTNGLVRVDFFGGADTPYDVLVQPDGKIVAAGLASNGTGGGLGMARVVP